MSKRPFPPATSTASKEVSTSSQNPCDPTSPYYDPFDASCSSFQGTSGMCIWPQVWDDISGQCVDPNSITSGSQDQGSTSVTVNIANGVDIVNSGANYLADAVKTGIAEGAAQAEDIANQTQQDITSALGNVVDKIGSSVQSFLGSIWDTLKSIASSIWNQLGSIVSAIVNNIGSAINSIADAVKSVITPVVSVVTNVAQEIQDINDHIIQPLTSTILGTITTISTLTSAIERDLHDGLSGILKIPTDVANAMTSLDATMQRTVEQLGTANKELVTTTIGGSADDTLWTRLKTLGSALGEPPKFVNLETVFKDSVTLSNETLDQAVRAAIPHIESELSQLLGDLWPTLTGVLNKMNGVTAEQTSMVTSLMAGLIWAGVALYVLSAEISPISRAATEESNVNVRMTKLEANEAIQAWLRKFITDDELTKELSYAGYDDTRTRVLRDLTNKLLDTSVLLDGYLRGFVTKDTLYAQMSQMGYSDGDQDIMIQQSYARPSISDATRAYRFGIITQDQLTSVLRQNHYTDDDAAMYVSTVISHETVEDVITRERIVSLYSGLQFSDPNFANVSDDVLAAAKRDGVDQQVALDAWQKSFYVPQIGEYIALYFRGIRTLSEVYAVMDYYRVPVQIRQDLIDARRPLVPWRTIPTMVKDGIINEAQAAQLLAAHGFKPSDIDVMLKYATFTTQKNVANASGSVHQLSLGNARLAWELGTITDAQYTNILEEHGYDASAAAVLMSVQKTNYQLSQRRTIAKDIEAEVLAGTITMDQANQQMSAQNFSAVERSNVINAINRAQRQANKIPSEAELHDMASKGAITVDTYKSTLQLLGYSAQWVDAFFAWRFPSAAQSTNS